jgi:cytochrome b pre-mRNA-processing protein 3
MPLSALFRRSPITDSADKLYLAAVKQARRPEFYRRCGVPDTATGRFEMIALHVFLLLYRLKGETDEGAALAQGLFDAMFADMDRNLREMGTGDLSVGGKIRRLAEGFYGRVAAYDAGLAAGEEGLADALGRNLYATAEGPAAEGPATEGPADALGRNLYATAEGAATEGPATEGPADALGRNLYGAMAAYARREADNLSRQDLAGFLAGRAEFGPPPAAP